MSTTKFTFNPFTSNFDVIISTIDLTADVTGILPIANGGTNISTYTTGDTLYASSSNVLSKLPIGSTGNILTVAGGVPTWAAPATSGTVTSVGLALPADFTVTISPITTSGTLTAAYVTQSANTFFAGPTSGGPATPGFRLISPATDIPIASIDLTSKVTSTLPVANGGTGLATLTAHDVLVGNGTGGVTLISPSTSGFILTSNGTGADPTFQANSAANAITALTGDVTATGPGSVAATLATVNANVGSFGSSTSIPNFTVNAKGLITAAGGNVVIAPAGTLSGTTLNATVVSSSLTSVGTITTGVWNGTSVTETHGGTGQSSYTTGDTLYASASNTLSKLPIGSTNQVLTVVAGVPAWAAATGSTAINARYTNNAGTTVNSSLAIVNFANQTYDSGSNVTTGASWKFTVPTGGAGVYLVAVSTIGTITGSGSATSTAFLYKNGSQISKIAEWQDTLISSGVAEVRGTDSISLVATDFIDIRMQCNASYTLDANNQNNFITIQRIN